MKRFLFSILLLALFAQLAYGQTTLAVDLDRAALTWNYTQGTGGAVEEFRMHCGPSTGNYDTMLAIADPAARSVPVRDVVSGRGRYFCAVSAANIAGESAVSNEVFFDAETIPVAPTNLSVTAQ